ncbi:MAG: aminotransferase class I/II-fold pyridoxal phosphate-dependent enzyme, partial [FCB group bacterium]|nr:aminotransferase class I/II-fold pyridoxal phosphate-dependent enzyme [FCB group bacterium]
SRCGWLEVLNKNKDENFATYVNSLLAAKRLEVSSTTVPQMSSPRVKGDERYPAHLERREAMYAQRAQECLEALQGCDSIIVNTPHGAFYVTDMFKPGVLNKQQTLPIENKEIREYIESMVPNVSPDKRFVYYLMGALGIVVVPLTGFQCTHEGFRMTLLENDESKRAWIFKSIREAIDQYVASA